eukprot:TRINITY_DN11513_c0_g1_i2.p1 TRINITY_DN11513_c0_g1~~TRINITY_DN11513_c0_g1_i2.p1  ORF type:complete len:785 (+),score=102.48 TRINITY_DN11513_c0_g1_i2:54-2408(+)
MYHCNGRAATRVQRRTGAMLTMGGVGRANAPALIDPTTGKKEPGWIEPSALWAMQSPVDTWSMHERPGRGQMNWNKPDAFLYGEPSWGDKQRAINEKVVPYSSTSSVPFSSWADRLPEQELVASGLEWEDPDKATLDRYSKILSSEPEAALLHPHICAALHGMGIDHLTRSQAETMYYLNIGHDVMLGSHPGSGKTSAIAWHILNKLLKDYPNAPFSTLWIVPHENLARQTLRLLSTLGKLTGIPDDNTFCLCVDSKRIEDNYDELVQNMPSVLIGTPNRIGDLIHIPDTILTDIEFNTLQRIVVDEVDEVLPASGAESLGESLMYALALHRRNKRKDIKFNDYAQQKMFLSSTLGNEDKSHLQTWFRSRAGKVIENHYGQTKTPMQGDRSGPTTKRESDWFVDFRKLEEDGTSRARKLYGGMGLQKDIEHLAISCTQQTRWEVLTAAVAKLSSEQNNSKHNNGVHFRGLIIVKNGASAKSAADALYKIGYKGKVGRLENPVALESYANGTLPILISTPRFVRGMNLPYLTHVFICSGVSSSGEYVRLAGRVGRAGRSGICVSIASPDEFKGLRSAELRLNADIRKINGTDFSNEKKVYIRAPIAGYVTESKEHQVQHQAPTGTAAAKEVSFIKSLLIDDQKALSTLQEGEPNTLTKLDMERNIVDKTTGRIRPKGQEKDWLAGTSPSIFYNEKELTEIELKNTYTYVVKPEADLSTPSTMPDPERQMPGGSINPDIHLRHFSRSNQKDPVVTYPIKEALELDGPVRDGDSLLRQHREMLKEDE